MVHYSRGGGTYKLGPPKKFQSLFFLFFIFYFFFRLAPMAPARDVIEPSRVEFEDFKTGSFMSRA